MPVGEQHTVALNTLPNDRTMFQSQYPPAAQKSPTATYDFFMDPPPPPKRSLLPGGGSLLSRVAVIGVGLILLIIAFSVVKGFLTPKSNLDSIISVAQDQQALVHLSQTAIEQPTNGLSKTANKNYALTAQASLTSARNEVITYLATNKKKVSSKAIVLKVKLSDDQTLKSSADSGTFDQTFKELAQTKLNIYMKDLEAAYKLTKGPKGRELLSKEFTGAKLLNQQLNGDGH